MRLSKRLDSLRRKKAQLIPSLAFLLRCRDTGIIPGFLKIRRLFKTSQAHRIYNRMEKAMLRERIHNIRKELAKLDKELFGIHLRVSNVMTKEDWGKFDNISHLSMQTRMTENTERQKKKFDKFSPVKPTIDTSRTVVNLTKYELTQDQISVLSKGRNFAITPNKIPVEDIISSVEASIRSLPESESEEIRTEVSRILRKAKPPRPNIKLSEKRAIKELNTNNNILILPADKGNATVIMETDDYKKKINNLLEPTTYRKLPKDPTSKVLRRVNGIVRASTIPVDIQRTICKTEAVPPRLYGLPKIHKTAIPLRPIVSAIGSPTYHVAKHLSKLLQPHVGRAESHVKDSAHFIQKITRLHVEPEDILISFDVVSLFTKVPITESLEYISKLFTKDITELFRECLTTSYFLWDGHFYEQIDGVAMGSPLSPVIANFFMEQFEQLILETAPLKPKAWYRYVDDTFVIWNHGEKELEVFFKHLNSGNKNIQFTMEKERDGQLPFLDILVTREGEKLGHTVYRKPTHTDRYLNKDSNHHPCQKRGIIKTLTERARVICQPEHLGEEIKHLEEAFLKNGYSRKEIRRAIKPSKGRKVPAIKEKSTTKAFLQYIPKVTDRIGKLLEKHDIKTIYMPTRKIEESLRSAKDSRDPKTSSGVYRIPCSCGEVYIGTTKRSINTRIDEHRRHCRLLQGEKSSVAEHALINRDHTILFKDTQVLSNIKHYHTRLHREAIEICKHKNCFNKKEEGLKVKKVWYPVVNMCTIKPYVTGTNKITKDTVEQTTGQSRISTGAGQSQSSHAPSPAYITRSQSRQAARTTRTVAEDTPEDAVHSRRRNVELLR